jgi:hypothetical protein
MFCCFFIFVVAMLILSDNTDTYATSVALSINFFILFLRNITRPTEDLKQVTAIMSELHDMNRVLHRSLTNSESESIISR